MNFLTESACAIREMFLIKRPFFPRCRFRKCPTMAKPTKKKSSAKRPSASSSTSTQGSCQKAGLEKGLADRENRQAWFFQIQKRNDRVSCPPVGYESSREKTRSVCTPAERKAPSASRCHGRFHGWRCPGHPAVAGRRQRSFCFWNASGRRRIGRLRSRFRAEFAFAGTGRAL